MRLAALLRGERDIDQVADRAAASPLDGSTAILDRVLPALTDMEKILWPSIRAKLNPVAWAFYHEHEHDRVGSVLHIFHVYVDSLGLVSRFLTALLGPETAGGAA